MLKRLFDIFFSFIGLIILLPFFLLISLLIVIDSKGGVFYRQLRVGKDNFDFKLLKFRSMQAGSETKGLLTVGNKDARITTIGYFIRKHKIDELPQLINVLKGDMSLVGPRPEVRKYVKMYSQRQMNVLAVKPGITDYASLEYFNENELLAKSEDPESTYIDEVMPSKLSLNLYYIEKRNLKEDFVIILRTLKRIIN